MKTNGNDSVAPYSVLHADGSVYEQHIGLTKREYFAAMALQGLCANPEYIHWSDEKVSGMAIGEADRLIEALNK